MLTALSVRFHCPHPYLACLPTRCLPLPRSHQGMSLYFASAVNPMSISLPEPVAVIQAMDEIVDEEGSLLDPASIILHNTVWDDVAEDMILVSTLVHCLSTLLQLW